MHHCIAFDPVHLHFAPLLTSCSHLSGFVQLLSLTATGLFLLTGMSPYHQYNCWQVYTVQPSNIPTDSRYYQEGILGACRIADMCLCGMSDCGVQDTGCKCSCHNWLLRILHLLFTHSDAQHGALTIQVKGKVTASMLRKHCWSAGCARNPSCEH